MQRSVSYSVILLLFKTGRKVTSLRVLLTYSLVTPIHLFRPHFHGKTLTLDIKLEYCVQFWDPHYKKGIKMPFMELVNCLENKFFKISLNKSKYLTPSG